MAVHAVGALMARKCAIAMMLALFATGCVVAPPESERVPNSKQPDLIYIKDAAGDCWALKMTGKFNDAWLVTDEACASRRRVIR